MAAVAVLIAAPSQAAPATEKPQRQPHVTLPWAVAQLVPSPGLAFDDGVHFAARWQLTPVAYSFGVHRSQSRVRSFVVPPVFRYSGSVELYGSPEYVEKGDDFGDRFGVRVGLRAYLPVLHRGDYLALSYGSSWSRFQGQDAVGYEAGAHVLFGFVGLIVTVEPSEQRWFSMMHLRFF